MGLFIAIEGGDGSGKTTQADLLVNHLESSGKKVFRQKFPRYGEDSAYYIEQYLNGAYGPVDNVPADLGVLPYALDRYAASAEIRSILNDPEAVLICDRYMGSNLAHHGAKVADRSKRHDFYSRTLITEYEVLGVPRPDINIVLLVPTDLAQDNIDNRPVRQYTSKKRDIHETDINHLELTKRNYEELCDIYTDEFTALDCVDAAGNLLPIDKIQARLREIVQI